MDSACAGCPPLREPLSVQSPTPLTGNPCPYPHLQNIPAKIPAPQTFPATPLHTPDAEMLLCFSTQVGGARHRVAPPRTLLAVEGDTDVWPRHTYQALVVAAEYCAALQEVRCVP